MAHRVRQAALLVRVTIAIALLAGCAPIPGASGEPGSLDSGSSPLATRVVAPTTKPEPTPTVDPTEAPAPASTPDAVTIPPSDRLETRVELVESCLWEPDRAQVTFEISWDGTVSIEGYDDAVDGGGGGGGSSSFPSTTSGSHRGGFDVSTGVRHVFLVSFRADFDGDGLYGPIVREVEVPFTVDPENSCR